MLCPAGDLADADGAVRSHSRTPGVGYRHPDNEKEEHPVATTESSATSAPATPSLYERLGGYDAIAAATDDLLARLQADPQLGGYWKGASHDNRRRARQLIVDFMTEAAGGPAFYTGRDMKTSHAGMGISGSDWDAFLGHARATLDHFGVGERERGEVLAFLESLKGDVVETY
jgi:hemoglobin